MTSTLSAAVEQVLERRAKHEFAVPRHVDEVSSSVAATCRYYRINRICSNSPTSGQVGGGDCTRHTDELKAVVEGTDIELEMSSVPRPIGALTPPKIALTWGQVLIHPCDWNATGVGGPDPPAGQQRRWRY